MTDETPRLTEEDKIEIRNHIRQVALAAKAGLPKETEEEWRAYHAENDSNIPQTQKDVALYAFQDTLKSLMETHPEISLGLGHMPVIVSNRTAAIATDNNELYISPSWWAKKSPRELRHCAAFAALSIIYDTINRGKAIEDVDHWRWELACNLVINRTLIDEGIGVMPAEGALITSITTQMTSEEVYATLVGMKRAEIVHAIWPLKSGHLLDLTEFMDDDEDELVG